MTVFINEEHQESYDELLLNHLNAIVNPEEFSIESYFLDLEFIGSY